MIRSQARVHANVELALLDIIIINGQLVDKHAILAAISTPTAVWTIQRGLYAKFDVIDLHRPECVGHIVNL